MLAELLMTRSPLQPSPIRGHQGRRAIPRFGFTLIEIMIVVVILGILAAVVVPQFSNASQQTRVNTLLSQLSTLRWQIQFFKAQHNDILPDLVANQWNQFQSTTNLSGAIDLTAAGIFGPYSNKPPANPLNTYIAVAAGPGAGVGWIYNAATGDLTATNQTSTVAFDETTGAVQ